MSILSAVNKSVIPVAGSTASRTITPATYRGGNEFWMFNFDGKGNDVKFTYSDHQSSLIAYQQCPPLNAIINKKAKAYLNGKTWILNKKGKAKNKEADGVIASKIRTLLNKPNPVQNWSDFEAQNYIYQQLFEFCIVLPIKPVGFDNIEATSLWNIPANIIDIEETQNLWYKDPDHILKKIVIKWKGDTGYLPVDDIFIFRQLNLSFESILFPQSRIKSLQQPINNIIGAYDSRGFLIDSRGAQGIISPDSKDGAGIAQVLTDKQKEELQEQFLRYGIKSGQWKYIMSSAAIKFEQMGIPTKDLMLFEEIDDNIQRICDSYDWPYRLMSSDKSNSLGGSDLKEFKKVAYQDAIIPESKSIYEQWDKFFQLDKYGLTMVKDYSEVPALQEDRQKMAQARKTNNEAREIEFYNNLCTLNEWRESNGDDPLEGEDGKMFYYQLLANGWKFGQRSTGGNQNNNQQNQQQENNQQQ